MKRLVLALGCALAAITVVASAQTAQTRTRINPDANNDGWLTRDEAAASADQVFARLDQNNDGRLNDEDFAEQRAAAERARHTAHEARERAQEARERAREAAEAAREGAREAREEAREVREAARRAHDEARREGRHVERHVYRDGERTIIIIRGDPDEDFDLDLDIDVQVPPIPPMPPMPPMPPVPPVAAHPGMFMMSFGHSGEADLDGDGGLSREEFRAQQLRYFDAADANRDGRIRFERHDPPAPPQPPAPPAAPQPPTRR